MDVSDLEGSIVLEKLALLDLVEDFYAAIDTDDFKEARRLLIQAAVDRETIQAVLKAASHGESIEI